MEFVLKGSDYYLENNFLRLDFVYNVDFNNYTNYFYHF